MTGSPEQFSRSTITKSVSYPYCFGIKSEYKQMEGSSCCFQCGFGDSCEVKIENTKDRSGDSNIRSIRAPKTKKEV